MSGVIKRICPITGKSCYSLTHLSNFSIPLAPLGWVQGIDFFGTNHLSPRHLATSSHGADSGKQRTSLPTSTLVDLKKMLQMARKRIQKEILDLGKENLGDMKLEPSESSIFEWIGSIPGPISSVYEGGVFNVKITLPNDYP
jgi:hypothetical protein